MPGRAGGPRNLLDDDLLVVVLALIAGLVAALGPAEPTGHAATDAILLAVGTGLIVLIGALAPWWAVVVAAAAGWRSPSTHCSSGSPSSPSRSRSGTARAVAEPRRDRRLARPVLQRPRPRRGRWAARHVGDRHVRRRRARLRHRHPPSLDPRSRTAWIGLGVVVLFGGLATAGFAYEAVESRHELASGLSTAELGVAALEDGRFEDAAGWFREAHRLPRVGQRPARQAVGAGGRRRAGRRHLPARPSRT